MWWLWGICVVFAVLTYFAGKWANSQPGDDFGVAVVPLGCAMISFICGMIWLLLMIYHWFMGV